MTAKSPTIVLAEDEPLIGMAYQEGLTHAGFNVTLASDGQEALEAIENQQPDLVLLDLIMPKMNGFETLKAIRKNPSLANLPVMIVSNLSQTSDKNQAEELGATDFLIKSDISLAELITRVNKILDWQPA